MNCQYQTKAGTALSSAVNVRIRGDSRVFAEVTAWPTRHRLASSDQFCCNRTERSLTTDGVK